MDVPAIIGLSAAALLIGLVGTPPLRAPGPWLRAAASFLALWGAAGLLVWLAWDVTRWGAPLLSTAIAALAGAAAILVPYLLSDRTWRPDPSIRWTMAPLCGLVAADAVALVWLDVGGPDIGHHATVAGYLQPIVASSVAVFGARSVNRLKGMETHDRKLRKQGRASDPGFEQLGKVAWFQMLGIGLAAVVVSLKVLGVWAGTNGFDTNAVLPDAPAAALAGIGGLVCAVALVARHRSRPPREGGNRVEISPDVAGLLVVACVCWGAAPHLLASVYTAPGWSASLTLLLFAVTAHSLWFHAAGEHLVGLGRSAILVATACASAVASTFFWLLSAGVVIDGKPVRASESVDLMLAVILTNWVLTTIVGGAMARHRPGKMWSRYSPQQGIANDVIAYAGMALLAGVVPSLLAAYVATSPPDDPRTLVFITVLLSAGVQASRLVPLFVRNMRSYISDEKDYVRKVLAHDADEQLHFDRVERHFRDLERLLWLGLSLGSLRALIALL